MIMGLLLSIALTTALLGILGLATFLSRGPPLRPFDPAPAVTAAGPATLWVCVTPSGHCASPPRPRGEPCSCLETWHGWRPGRVDADPVTKVPLEAWPSRPASAAGDDPEESSFVAP